MLPPRVDDPRPESVAPLGSFGAWTSLCLLIFGYISNTVCFLSPMSSPTSFHITFNLSPKDILMLTLASVTALIPGAGMYLVFGRRSARWTVILASTVSFAGILVQCLMTINTMASLYISQVLFGFSHAIFQLLLSYRACSLLPGLGEKEVLVILTLVDALVYVVGFLAVPLLVWGMEWTHMQIFLALLLAASAVLVTCMYPGEAGDLCGCPKSNTVVIASRLLVRGRICSGLVLLGLAAGHGGLLGWQFTETILLATYWNFTDSLSVVHGHGVLYCTPVLIALTCLIASVPGMGLSLHPVSSGPSFRKSLLLPLLLLLPFLIGLSVLWGLLCFQPTHEVGASLWCCLLFGSSLGAGTYSCLSRKWGTLLVSPQTSMVLTHMARSLGSLLFVLAVLVQYTQTSYNNWRIICWLLAGFPSVGGVLLLFVFPLSKLDKGTDQLYDKLESDVLQGIGVGPSSRGVHCGPV